MKILENSALTLGVNQYVINSAAGVQNCSSYLTYFGLLHDAARDQAWETFGTPAVPAYFTSGMLKFKRALEAFADLKKPSSEKTERELLFMLEALVQARQLMRE